VACRHGLHGGVDGRVDLGTVRRHGDGGEVAPAHARALTRREGQLGQHVAGPARAELPDVGHAVGHGRLLATRRPEHLLQVVGEGRREHRPERLVAAGQTLHLGRQGRHVGVGRDHRVQAVRRHRHRGTADQQRPRIPRRSLPGEGDDGDRGDHDHAVDDQRPRPRLPGPDPGAAGKVGQ
jgi:hypothetical protein